MPDQDILRQRTMKAHTPALFGAAATLAFLVFTFGMRGLNLNDPSLGDTVLLCLGLLGMYSAPVLWLISLILVVKQVVEKRDAPYLGLFLLLLASAAAVIALESL